MDYKEVVSNIEKRLDKQDSEILKRMDSQYDKVNSKLDKILDELHNHDKRIQKTESQLGLIHKGIGALGVVAMSMTAWFFRGE